MLVIAAGATGTAVAGRRRLTVWSKGLLGADAPIRGRLDRIPVNRIQIALVGADVHAFMAQVRTVQRRNVSRREFGMGHGHTTFIPAAFRIARFTAVRAIWTLYAF